MTKVKITMGNQTYEVTRETYLRMQSQNKQSDRRETARRLKRTGMTYQRIGELMGITRQRACQLVMPTRGERKKMSNGITKCANCGRDNRTLQAHHDNYEGAPTRMLCISCHKKADAALGLTR